VRVVSGEKMEGNGQKTEAFRPAGVINKCIEASC